MHRHLKWSVATPSLQGTLFPVDLERYVPEIGVRWHEVFDWQRRGWLSWPGRDPLNDGLDMPAAQELLFVRELVRADLEPSQVECLLRNAGRPLSFDLTATAYCFQSQTWVQAPSLETLGDILARDWRELVAGWSRDPERYPALLSRTVDSHLAAIVEFYGQSPAKTGPFNALSHPHLGDRPAYWIRPQRRQRTGDRLGSSGRERLAGLGLHRDELSAWRERGWLSEQTHQAQAEDLDESQLVELLFVSGLARSCLRPDQVHRILEPLPSPYRYSGTVWHPRFGLLTCAAVLDAPDFVDDHWEAAIEDLVLRGDSRLVGGIGQGLGLRARV